MKIQKKYKIALLVIVVLLVVYVVTGALYWGVRYRKISLSTSHAAWVLDEEGNRVRTDEPIEAGSMDWMFFPLRSLIGNVDTSTSMDGYLDERGSFHSF